ncbi:MAG: Hsp33 family molecular chaperone HslO, partial [Halanaerobiales bacterium]|nr:Hsp33 family molecular chaperone HslO [Halanaerobiales bacterium]
YELVAGLGKKEIEETLAQEGEIEVRCHFCNNTYTFEKEEVEELLAELEAGEKDIPEVDTEQIVVESENNKEK